jgi:arylsulfatase A-like enzyme
MPFVFLIRCVSICLATAALANSQPATASPSRLPNILMIALDDLNNWIGALGGPAITPNIDRLASRGTLFSNAYCVVPACNPSRVAVLTGLRPETTGQYGNDGNFRNLPGNRNLLTLPQHLANLGYTTLAAGKVFHHPRGLDRQARPLSDDVSWQRQYVGGTGTGGADRYRDERGWAKWLQGERGEIASDYGVTWAALWGSTPEAKEATNDWNVAQFCADHIADAPTDRPWFVAAGIFRPHAPLIAPQEFFDLYPLDKVLVPYVPPDDLADVPAIAHTNWSTPLFRAMRDRGEWQRAVQAYLACVSYADACVGVLLDALERSPHRDNTIVVLWGDHGWQLGHKERWEKFSLWRQGTQSPLIVAAPGFAPGVTKRAVSLLDIAPTLYELIGRPPSQAWEGHSLAPQMRDPLAQRQIPAVVTHMPGNHSVIFEEWNYIRYSDGSEELYNHRLDPAEYQNLIGQPGTAGIIEKLRPHLPAAR